MPLQPLTVSTGRSVRFACGRTGRTDRDGHLSAPGVLARGPVHTPSTGPNGPVSGSSVVSVTVAAGPENENGGWLRTSFASCSRLSAHLAAGTVSLREAAQAAWSRMQELRDAPRRDGDGRLAAVRACVGRLHWREPSLHLAGLFIDYEPGIHYPQMQMQSGTTGINTARICNPVKRSKGHDPDGRFIRRFVPELERLAAIQPVTPPAPAASTPPRYVKASR